MAAGRLLSGCFYCCVDPRRSPARLVHPPPLSFPSVARCPASIGLRHSSQFYCLLHSSDGPLVNDISKQRERDSNTGIKSRIDWLSLSEEEFDAHLDDLRQNIPNFGPWMLCAQECKDFCARRNMLLREGMDELADLLGDTDLISPLQEFRNAA